ncbi:secreted protein [Melampsora americana]|nr:secreted protein [Melampsora americana]
MNLKAQAFIAMALLHVVISAIIPSSNISSTQTVSPTEADLKVTLHSNTLVTRENYHNSVSSTAVQPQGKSSGFDFMGIPMPGGYKIPAIPSPGAFKIPGGPLPGSSDALIAGAKYPGYRYWKA